MCLPNTSLTSLNLDFKLRFIGEFLTKYGGIAIRDMACHMCVRSVLFVCFVSPVVHFQKPLVNVAVSFGFDAEL